MSLADEFPARLNVNDTAKLLGFAGHDVPVLIAAKLLDPLGNPAPNSPKYFARVVVLELANDQKWLNKATRALGKYWLNKRARKRNSSFPKSGGKAGRDEQMKEITTHSTTSMDQPHET